MEASLFFLTVLSINKQRLSLFSYSTKRSHDQDIDFTKFKIVFYLVLQSISSTPTKRAHLSLFLLNTQSATSTVRSCYTRPDLEAMSLAK